MKSETVHIPPSFGQALELGAAALKQMPRNLTTYQAQYWISHQGRLAEVLRQSLTVTLIDYFLADWQTFWSQNGFQINSKEIVIPVPPQGFDRLLVIPKGLTNNQAYNLCAKQFRCRCYKFYEENLDGVQNVRLPENDYAIWVRNGEFADRKYKKLSANQLKKNGIMGITLLERLVFELIYHSETGRHLDPGIIGDTLCSGSRAPDGHVPTVSWVDNHLWVSWDNPDDSSDNSIGREVIY